MKRFASIDRFLVSSIAILIGALDGYLLVKVLWHPAHLFAGHAVDTLFLFLLLPVALFAYFFVVSITATSSRELWKCFAWLGVCSFAGVGSAVLALEQFGHASVLFLSTGVAMQVLTVLGHAIHRNSRTKTVRHH